MASVRTREPDWGTDAATAPQSSDAGGGGGVTEAALAQLASQLRRRETAAGGTSFLFSTPPQPSTEPNVALASAVEAGASDTGATAAEDALARVLDQDLAVEPMLDLPHEDMFWSRHSWLGEVDRFELVKAVRRCRSRRTGARVDENEVGSIVRLLESAEARMCEGDFDAAFAALLRCVASAPSLSLAYYRAALCALAGGGDTVMEAAIARAGPRSVPPSAAERRQQVVPALLRAAVRAEPDNPALRGSVDLLLRIMSRVPVPRAYWTAQYPKSHGDVAALAAFVVREYGGGGDDSG